MAQSLPPAHLRLEVLRHGQEHSTHVFDAAADRRVIIGRGPTCDLVIHDSSFSRKHTMLLCTRTGWQVEDLGSTNGTYLNGRRVKSSVVEPGDVLQIGQTEIRVVSAGEPPASLVKPAELVIDLERGTAALEGEPLPLSSAELIWFAFLSSTPRSRICRPAG